MVDFDIQSFLQDMREDLGKRHDTLSAKMDMFALALHQHQLEDAAALAKIEVRLVGLETAYSNVKWLMRSAYTAIFAALADIASNHLPALMHWIRP